MRSSPIPRARVIEVPMNVGETNTLRSNSTIR